MRLRLPCCLSLRPTSRRGCTIRRVAKRDCEHVTLQLASYLQPAIGHVYSGVPQETPRMVLWSFNRCMSARAQLANTERCSVHQTPPARRRTASPKVIHISSRTSKLIDNTPSILIVHTYKPCVSHLIYQSSFYSNPVFHLTLVSYFQRARSFGRLGLLPNIGLSSFKSECRTEYSVCRIIPCSNWPSSLPSE